MKPMLKSFRNLHSGELLLRPNRTGLRRGAAITAQECLSRPTSIVSKVHLHGSFWAITALLVFGISCDDTTHVAPPATHSEINEQSGQPDSDGPVSEGLREPADRKTESGPSNENAPPSESLNEGLPDTDKSGDDGATPPPPRGDVAAPRVVGVTPSPGAWVVDNQGLSDITIVFDQEVSLPAGGMVLWSQRLRQALPFESTYDVDSSLLTIHLQEPVRDDRLTLVLDHLISNLGGLELDGEIAAPDNPALPTGNGLRGGPAVIRFSILQGDANRDGIVDTADGVLIQASLGKQVGQPGFDARADLNGDGFVNVLDVGTYGLAVGRQLPPFDGVAPSLVAIQPDPTTPFLSGISELALTFSEPLNDVAIVRSALYVMDPNGGVHTPKSFGLGNTGSTVSFGFEPPLPPCSNYPIQISNVFADASGMLASPPPAAPVLSGFGVPPPPSLDPFDTVVSENSVTITGAAPGATAVIASGPAGTIEFPVSGPEFSANIPLLLNRLNNLFLTSRSACGILSASAAANIIQDGTPPELFIDFPANGSQLTTSTSDVAGRVSDLLSGVAGDIAVTVNGIPAMVNIGIGTNGTFFAPAVALNGTGQQTVIKAVATDGQNTRETQIVVTRVAVPAGAPTIEVVSGNGQMASMQSELSNPIVVQVRRPNGDAFEGKVVQFEVIRSNGRLRGDAGADCFAVDNPLILQCRSDAAGLARAFWTLGSDAGMGNNRIEVTSEDVVGTTVFCASATTAGAHQINIGTGNFQSCEVNGSPPEPLRAWVTDACNPVPEVPVTFTVIQGGGLVDGQIMVTKNTGPTGHAGVDFKAGPLPGTAIVQADYPGNMNLPATFTVYAKARTSPSASYSGIVMDNSNRPLQGCVCWIVVNGQDGGIAVTDEQGQFRLEDVPPGSADLYVNGETATHVGGVPVEPGSYPFMHYLTFVIPNTENSLPMPVMLPRLNPINRVRYDGSRDAVLTVRAEDPDNPGQLLPEVDGLKFIVRAGTIVTHPDGSTVPDPNDANAYIDLSINQVHRDEIPMPFPDGAAPPYAGTFQPAGCHFNPPVEVQIPNMTGMPAGAISYFMSFNHETNKFEIVCSAHVTPDAALIISDPGSGITTSGWHANCPPYPITGGGEGDGGGCGGPNCDGGQCPGPSAAPSCEPCGSGSGAAGSSGSGGSGGGDSGGFGGGFSKPVNLFSGEETLSVEDLRIKGRGLDFVWTRRYTSKRNLRPVEMTMPNMSSAQGNNWDYSYNVFIETSENPNEITVCDGAAHRDTYSRRPDETFTRKGNFRELMRDPNTGAYTMRFGDTGMWMFDSPPDAATPGKLHTIMDRNGNAITLFYDAMNRLERVRDTLDRDILIGYNEQGMIESVTDFTGRQVRYEYYGNGEAGGSPGDLKSVTTPEVLGTPNGNDFPSGKTTTYTYSTGFEDPCLNGNLLSITDAKGQTFVQNVYADTTDPNDIRFDRVVRQIWGDTGDITDFVYVPQTPTPANFGAVIKVIVNDRVGNVNEMSYNTANQLVIERTYTGRADPDLPTTETDNRPTNPLRPEDPPYFETRYSYTDDYKIKQIEHPNGNITLNIYESDLNPTASQRIRGNLRQVVHLPGTHAPAGDQTQIIEQFEYEADLGCGCGNNFVTRQVDARGNITQHAYDAQGNRIQTIHRDPAIQENREYNQFGQLAATIFPDNGSGHRQRDEYHYFESGSSRGYLREEVADFGHLNLTTQYSYDLVGNVVARTDPRGNTTNFVVNQLDQVVRTILPPDPSGARYERDAFYDANNNVVRMDVLNVLDDGTIGSNTHFSTIYEFEILNHVVRICQERGSAALAPGVLSCFEIADLGQFIVTEYEYDGNRNRTLVRFGEATAGHDPYNAVMTLFDERNLVFREIRAPGHATDQSTTQYDYDANRNLIRRLHGLEASGGAHAALHTFDGYDRMIGMTDAMGNASEYHYDANGNRISEKKLGELVDVPGSAANIRLSETTTHYDVMDRPFRIEQAFFDAAGQAIGDGLAVTETAFTPRSQVGVTTNDNGHTTTTTYDTASRRSLVTDAKGNKVAYQYDQNSNLRFVIETEKHDLPGRADEMFATELQYDALDRQIAIIDNVGSTNRSYYDSRNNRTRTLDALNHEVLYQYDGLSRLVRTIRDMDGAGFGSANPAAVAGDPDIGTESVVTEQGWDDSSRLTSQTDDNGNTTTYVHDALNRKTAEAYADGTSKQFEFDAHDNNVFWTDGNQNLVTQTFDDDDRLIRRDVIPGPGVSDDTTFEVYKFDGLGRLTWAEDDDTLVTRQHDSLSRVTRETQDLNDDSNPPWPTAVVTSTYDGVGNLTRLGYPSGRIITTTYDELERKKTIVDTTNAGQPEMIAEYWYVGPGRVSRRDYGNGTRSEWTYDGITGAPNPPGDFGVKRIVRTNHFRISDGMTIDDRTYTWDRMSNKTRRRDIRTTGSWAPQLTHDYAYDHIYRLVQSDKSDPNGSIETIQYILDGVGNRRQVIGGPDSGLYVLDPGNGNAARNLYTVAAGSQRAYDMNGNTRSIDNQRLDYDYVNRMTDNLANSITHLSNDALGRRVLRSTSTSMQQRSIYHGWRELVIVDEGLSEFREFAWGATLSDVAAVCFDAEWRFYHSDEIYSRMACSDAKAEVLKRWEYSDFGAPSAVDTVRTLSNGQQADADHLFQGSRWDDALGIYDLRTRWSEPRTGAFLQLDFAGIWYDVRALGRGVTAHGNAPTTFTDIFGLACSRSGYWMHKPSVADAVENARISFEMLASDPLSGPITSFNGNLQIGEPIARINISTGIRAHIRCVKKCDGCFDHSETRDIVGSLSYARSGVVVVGVEVGLPGLRKAINYYNAVRNLILFTDYVIGASGIAADVQSQVDAINPNIVCGCLSGSIGSCLRNSISGGEFTVVLPPVVTPIPEFQGPGSGPFNAAPPTPAPQPLPGPG